MHPFETASERVDCARPAEAVGGHLFADLYGVGKTAMTVTGRFSCSAVAFEMNKTFAKTLIDNMERYSNEGARADTDAGAREASSEVSDEQPRADDKIRRVRGEVEEVKQVMTDNIDRILERGDKIELLVDKSQDLSEQANKFKKSSTQLRRNMWWRNAKLQAIVGCGILAVAIGIALSSTKCFGAC